MHERTALWLSPEDISDLTHHVANHLSGGSVDELTREVLSGVLDELAVAEARENLSRIKFSFLSLVIGKEPKSIPIKLSQEELHVLVENVDLPISLSEKLFD